MHFKRVSGCASVGLVSTSTSCRRVLLPTRWTQRSWFASQKSFFSVCAIMFLFSCLSVCLCDLAKQPGSQHKVKVHYIHWRQRDDLPSHLILSQSELERSKSSKEKSRATILKTKLQLNTLLLIFFFNLHSKFTNVTINE